MAIIYKPSDRIKVKIDDVTFKVSPLTREHKLDVLRTTFNSEGDSYSNLEEMTFKLIKYTIKEVVKGIQNIDGSNYELILDNEILSDECANDLLNMAIGEKIRTVAQSLTNGIPDKFIDPETGDKLKGVEIVSERKKEKK